MPGTHGVRRVLLMQLEPVASSELVGYDTGCVFGFVVEHYQVVLFEAAEHSLQSMHQKFMELCAAQIPGDTHRNLEIHPIYSGRTFKHVLVPVWLLSYTYGATIYQVVVNGYSGSMA